MSCDWLEYHKSDFNPLKNIKLSWENLLATFDVNKDVARQVFLELATLYLSSERFYHTLAHVQHCLKIIYTLSAKAHNIESLEFAAWFHDVIYDPKAKDNEEKSAEYAEAVLSSLKIRSKLIYTVKNLILNTKSHQPCENNIDSKIMLDADLAILGADAYKYLFYSQAIRQEYAWVPDEQYRSGRKQFLRNILDRERIYFTEEMFESLEIKARHNIKEEIKYLS